MILMLVIIRLVVRRSLSLSKATRRHIMNNPTFICKTDADFLLETFCFKDGVAFFYGKIKNGIIEYFVNDGRKVHGPFEVCPKIEQSYYPSDLENLSIKNFEWYLPGKEYDAKSEEKWHKTLDLLKEIADDIAKVTPETEYDEKYHILRINNPDKTTKEQYFVAEAKKYGPYAYVFPAIYQNENNFQFVFKKKTRKKHGLSTSSGTTGYYYNYNGKEYKIGKEVPYIYYDVNGRAVLEQPDLNYILIDGKKKDFFNGECTNCSIKTNGLHTMIVGKDKDSDKVFRYIQDGVEHTIHTSAGISFFDCESITYCSEHGIWYHNETQISVSVPVTYSEIIGSSLRYKKQDIPYIIHKSKTYNGTTGYLNAKTQGFVYLEGGALYFTKHSFPEFLAPRASEVSKKSSTELVEEMKNNIKTLAAEHRLAGE